MNTEAANSTKLTFLMMPGVKSMRTVKNAHKKPATTTAGKNQMPKGTKNALTKAYRNVFTAARMVSRKTSLSELRVYIILPFKMRMESTKSFTATTIIMANTIYLAI